MKLEHLLQLAKSVDVSNSITALSDGDLIDAVCDEIWGDFPLLERKSYLLDELMTRFMVAKDIKITPKGITPDGEPFRAENADSQPIRTQSVPTQGEQIE
jgi:hypothetical protein